MKRSTRLVALLSLASLSVFGQETISVDGAYYRAPEKSAKQRNAQLAPPSAAAGLGLPIRATLPALSAEERNSVAPLGGRDAVGVHRSLKGQAESVRLTSGLGTRVPGAWSDTPGNARVWRWTVNSPGALAMRVHLKDFQTGGRLWIYGANGIAGRVEGPFTGKGPHSDGDFWSPTVEGEVVTLEYQAPAGDTADAVPFQVAEISHLWRGLAGSATPREQAGPCHVDATCEVDYTDTARGVARILYEEGGGTFTCSGTLLNTTTSSFVPYFLTAAHCLKTQTAARTVEAFWFFQTMSCNGLPPNSFDVPRTNGANLRATLGDFGDPKGDFTLLELDSTADNVFFSGWTGTRPDFGTRVVGVHHPRGSHKRASRGSIVPDTFFGTDADAYAIVRKSQGRVEQGSSGSGLFSDPGRLVGVLSFGPRGDACSTDPFFAGYGQFSAFFPEIRSFLTGEGGPPPPPPGGGNTNVLIPDQPSAVSFPAVTGNTLFNGDSSFQLDVPADATRVTINLTTQTGGADVDLFIRKGQDVALDNGQVVADFRAETVSGNEQIVIEGADLTPGQYFVAFGLFTLNTAVQSTVTATVERQTNIPNPTGVTLTSGQPVDWTLPRVQNPTLFGGTSAYRIDVPAGATQLDVSLTTETAGADIDLHVRFGEAPSVVDGQIVSDFTSTGLTGDELVTITPNSGLQAGTYFIALVAWTENTIASGELRADVITGGGGGPGNAEVVPIAPGGSADYVLTPVDGPTLFNDRFYTVDVPANATRLVVDLLGEQSADVDVDLHIRFGQGPGLKDGTVVDNYNSRGATGVEQIIIDGTSTPPLQPGTYYIAVALWTNGREARGRIQVSLDTSDTGPSGPVAITAAVHAASFGNLAVAPGQILTLFGRGLGPGTGVQPGFDSSGGLQTFAGNTIVLFDGVPAPLFFVRGDQVNLQAPYTLAGRTETNIVVVSDGRTSNVLTVPVAPAVPELFRFSDGSNRVIAFNQDGSLNSPENPARRGEVVILFGTGEGLTTGPNREGFPVPNGTPLDQLPRPQGQTSILFGNATSNPLFAGHIPGFVGLLQVNTVIPNNAPTGAAVPISISVGGSRSQPGITIAIQ